MRHPFLKSIKTYLILMVLISALPALGIVLYMGMERQKDAVKDAELSALAVVNSLAVEHERVVESARQLLVTLSKLQVIRDGDGQASSALLADLLRQNPIYANLLMATGKGVVISSAKPFVPHSITHRKYFRDALSTRQFSAGEYSVGFTTGEPVIHFAYPVLGPHGHVKRVVAASVNLSRYGRIFLSAKLPGGSVLTLTDHKGLRLFRHPDADKYVGKPADAERFAIMTAGAKEGTLRTVLAQEKRLLAYKRFHLNDAGPLYLLMAVSISERQAMQEARRLLFVHLALLGIAFLVSVAGTLFVGKVVIARGLDHLVEASRNLGKGDLKSRTSLPHGKGELGHLAAAFDEMADSLEQKELRNRAAEKTLVTQLEFLQNLIDTIPNGIFYKDTNGIYQGCNRTFEEYVGVSRVNIVGRTVFEVHPREVADVYSRMDGELFSRPGTQTYDTVIRHRSGIKRDIIISKATYNDDSGRVAGLIGVMVDITERKEAERRLAHEKLRFSVLTENAPFGMVMMDGEGRFTYVNTAYKEMFGYDLIDVPDEKTWLSKAFPEPEYRNMAASLWSTDKAEELTADGGPRVFSTTCKDGTAKTVSFIPVRLEGGERIVNCEDITARFQAEKILKESEQTLRALINATRETLLLMDRDGKIIVANEVFAQRIGKAIPDLIGTSLYDHFSPDVAGRRKEYFDRVIATGRSAHLTDSRAGRFYEISAYPVFAAGGKVSRVAIFALDVTQGTKAEQEKERLESQLRQSQKMEAIGTLAGGVAHDFNNILTALIGYGSLLQMSMEAGDPRKIYVDQILTSSERAAVLTQSLLAFSRKQAMDLKVCRVAEVIREAEKLLKRLLTEDIEFRVFPGDPEIFIRADVTQIDQVLMNLATNARDAMPRGGRLTIEARAVRLDREFIEHYGFGEPGDYALICVTDTGSGMDAGTREKIFEPFFTTKEVGKGTGLGLSIVYGIITQHNGYINVRSEPGEGTTFAIYLPAEGRETTAPGPVPEEVMGGTETILVAEDNRDVRALVAEVLSGAGYTVISAVDGEEAVQQFMAREKEIDLLLLDVVMPRKNGKEVFDEIRKLRPDIKVLFTSGYTGDVVLDKGIPNGSVNFVSKPLMPGELLKKVRHTLDT